MLYTRDIISEVEDLLRTKASPNDLAWAKADLSAHYSFLCGALEEILKRKPLVWLEMRKTQASDRACDRVWDSTDDGINEIGIRLQLKRCDKIFSAISSLLRIAEGESKNNY